MIYYLFQKFFFVVDHKEQYMEYMTRLFRKTDAHLKYNGKNYKDFSLGRQIVHIDKKRYLKLILPLSTNEVIFLVFISF